MNQDLQWTPLIWKDLPQQQQPAYTNETLSSEIVNRIQQIPAPLSLNDVEECKNQLGQVFRGQKVLLQIGDCAEIFDECTEEHWNTKLEFYHKMGEILNAVVVGRICGQFAKPRSQLYESDGTFNYRGDLINSIDRTQRDPDPNRMMLGAQLAQTGQNTVKRFNMTHKTHIYTSHESLHLLYESSFVRNQQSKNYLSNVHMPWLGDRTRSSEQGHAQFAKGLINPIGVKIGVSINPNEFVKLIKLLNPNNEEGKVFAITRFGLKKIQLLKDLVTAKQKENIKVTFICDPMHGNTEQVKGFKIRRLENIKEEIRLFTEILRSMNEVVGGMHLEATPFDVKECVSLDQEVDGTSYTTTCDPRLNAQQTEEVVTYFQKLLSNK